MSDSFMSEVVEIKYSDEQNENLEKSLKDFYKMGIAPKMKRSLLVDKGEYIKFVKSRTRLRTQFEAQESEINLSFDERIIPFEFLATKTEFLMSSGENVLVHEELDCPNGLTKLVTVTSDSGKKEFMSYFQAESYVVDKFLAELEAKEIRG